MSSSKSKKEAPTVPYESMDMSFGEIRSHRPVPTPISLFKVISDVVSLIIVLAAWLILKYFVKPIRRAFTCSDLNLYQPPPIKTVFPTWLLFISAVLIPLILILLSEGGRWYYLVRKRAAQIVYKIRIRSNVYNIPEWAGNLYIILGTFALANFVNSFLSDLGKVTVGRLRPHFIPSCFNKFTYKDFCVDPTVWIANYTCIGESNAILKGDNGAYDIRQSFPSGHTSTAFCSLIFLALYIHKFWNYRHVGFLPYILETGCFALAAYIGITRLTDNRHHGTDVLCGAILGTVVAVIAFRYMIRSFQQTFPLDLDDETTKEGTTLHITP